MKKQLVLLILICLPLYATGQMKKVKVETTRIGLKNSRSARVKVSFLAGVMKVTTGQTDLVQGEFRYTQPEWKPVIGYERKNGTTDVLLKMSQEGREFSISEPDKNEWDITLNRDLPMDLALFMGAGEGIFDLAGTRLDRLYLKLGAGSYDVDLAGSSIEKFLVKAGVGEIFIDLTGDWDHNLVADLTCGIGEITMILPEETGVLVKTSGIIGGISASSFKKDGKIYTNSAYGKTKYKLLINIDGGIGHINLKQR